MVFASFIRDAAGVSEVREVLGEKGKKILIIPKIENQQGLKNLDEIIAACDGIMVARWSFLDIPLLTYVPTYLSLFHTNPNSAIKLKDYV